MKRESTWIVQAKLLISSSSTGSMKLLGRVGISFRMTPMLLEPDFFHLPRSRCGSTVSQSWMCCCPSWRCSFWVSLPTSFRIIREHGSFENFTDSRGHGRLLVENFSLEFVKRFFLLSCSPYLLCRSVIEKSGWVVTMRVVSEPEVELKCFGAVDFVVQVVVEV